MICVKNCAGLLACTGTDCDGGHFTVEIHYGAELELHQVSRSDSGVYLCMASNGVPPTVSKRVRLYVDCECNIARLFAQLLSSIDATDQDTKCS